MNTFTSGLVYDSNWTAHSQFIEECVCSRPDSLDLEIKQWEHNYGPQPDGEVKAVPSTGGGGYGSLRGGGYLHYCGGGYGSLRGGGRGEASN